MGEQRTELPGRKVPTDPQKTPPNAILSGDHKDTGRTPRKTEASQPGPHYFLSGGDLRRGPVGSAMNARDGEVGCGIVKVLPLKVYGKIEVAFLDDVEVVGTVGSVVE